jgi:hypothetical protein
MMVGDSYNITVAEGGFMVHVSRAYNRPPAVVANYVPQVFTDSAALLNYLHRELVGSN